MLKLLFFIWPVVFTARVSADNLLVNPCFDETQWDTGWTVEGNPGDGYIYAIPDTEKYYSAPRSCKLVANTVWDASARIHLYQEIPPVRGCTCGVYFQNIESSVGCADGIPYIYVKINGKYENEWWASGSNSVWTKWEKIYDTTVIVSGIKFSVWSEICMHASVAHGTFWIDNVYILGTTVGIEEQVEKSEKAFEIYPNPFSERTTICYPLEAIESTHANDDLRIVIHDLSGGIVREFVNLSKQQFNRIVWNGRDEYGNELSSGVYFIRLDIPMGKTKYSTQKLVKF